MNKNYIKIGGGVAAVLAALVSWQQLGGWFPASASDLQRVEVLAESNTLLILYAKLERLERDLIKAKTENNTDWIFALERQIEEVKRKISELEQKKGI